MWFLLRRNDKTLIFFWLKYTNYVIVYTNYVTQRKKDVTRRKKDVTQRKKNVSIYSIDTNFSFSTKKTASLREAVFLFHTAVAYTGPVLEDSASDLANSGAR